MSMAAVLRSSLRSISRCLRAPSSELVAVSCNEAAVQKALGAEGVYWSIGNGPHAAFSAFRQMGQHAPRTFAGYSRISMRSYQSYNSFVRSYQYG